MKKRGVRTFELVRFKVGVLRLLLLVDVAISEYYWMRPEVLLMNKSVKTVALEALPTFSPIFWA